MSQDFAAGPSVAVDGSPFGKPCGVVLADSEFVAAADARVSVHVNALSYGTGIFGGIRAFWNPARSDWSSLAPLDTTPPRWPR